MKTGIRLHGARAVDNIWKTCCALHNWLLEVDGLNAEWRSGVPSDFEGELGHHDLGDAQLFVPRILDRVINCTEFQGRLETFDATYMGNAEVNSEREVGDDVGISTPVSTSSSPCISVRSLSLSDFRDRLVRNFRFKWDKKMVKWPSRTGVVEYVAY